MNKLGLIITSIVISSCAFEYDRTEKVNFIDGKRGIVEVIPPENCPNWTKFNGTDYDNEYHSNYGCATINNYGQMIADPNDMISGKSKDEYDAQRTVNSVNAYRNFGLE